MSRVRQELSIVQFQVENRQASASMEALRERAKKLNEDITATNASIKALGNVAPDDAGLLAFQKTLKGLNSDLRDVTRAQNELMKGVKAADKLWKAAATGTMESLSVKEIKAGQRGIQARMQNLQPTKENARELQAMRIAIEEGEIAMRKFEADAERLVKTIREGGSVSSNTLSKAKTDLQGLLDYIPQGTKEWNRYNQQLTTVSEKLREVTLEQQRATGKDMLGRAFRGDFAGADAKTLEQTITKLKEYQSVIDDPRGKGARHFAAAETQIKQLQSTLDELKGKYTSADEVIQRFNQHLGETKMERVNTQAQTLAQTLDEKLSQATSVWDEDIQRETEYLKGYEQELKEAQEEVARLEAEYDKVRQRYQSRSALGKATLGRRDKERMAELSEDLDGDDDFMGARDRVEYAQESIEYTKKGLQWYKEQKAEALGLTEAVEQLNQAELQGEEKKQEARRMTREQMQQGIKVLEDEAFTIDRTTEDGKKRYEQLRQTIDQMNEEIKVAANEMMSLADAQELADKAMEEQALTTKTGWAASTEELKRAEQTLAEKVAKAKRGTAEEEAAYQKLVRQLQAVRTELSAGSMSGKQMMDVLANPENVTSVDTLKAAIGRARQELDALGRRIDQARMDGHTKEAEELAEAYDDIAEGAKNADQRMKELQAQSKGTASAFDKAWSRLKTYVGLYVGAAVAMQKLSQAMGDLLTLSDKMGEVRKTTGFTADEVGRLSNNLAKLDTRTTLTQLMELSSLAGSVGLKTQEQVQGFTEAANQLIVALPELGNESARTIIKIANATGDLEKNGGNVRETLEKVGSTIIALRANSASAAGPITDFVSRVGAVGAQAGISIDQIAALGSTIDALGGRVEMSATALSRMIPAIKNNSFAIANSIGVTEKYLKSLAPMEQMVLIFQKMRDNIQHIDTSTEQGQEQMAATIEGMLGKNATMREVMKDLEQQGARAGIVFGLLSQNVDELQKQLGIASEAYRENTALANEFANMNETTAAKWERLKNQFEESFVRDSAQRRLGWIIDRLREVVDLLTGNSGISVALRTIIVYLALVRLQIVSVVSGALKSLGAGLKNIGIMLGFIKGEMTAMQWGNIFTAAAAAVLYLIDQLHTLYKEAHQVETIVSEVMSKYATELDNATKKSDKMFESVGNARVAVKDANEEVKKAEEALKQAKKALDDGTGSTEKLEEAETNLKVAHEKVTRANLDHKSSIEQINREYSPYLGYMLSEISTAAELANARELINAKLRETILLKQQEAGYQRVEGAFGQKRDERQQDIYDLIGENVTDPERAARMRKEIIDLVKQAKDGSKTILDIRKEWNRIYRENRDEKWGAGDYQGMESYIWRLVTTEREIQDAKRLIDENVKADIKAARVGTKNTKGTQQELQDQLDAIYNGDKGKNNGLQQLQQQYEQADAKTRKQRAADLLKQMDAYESLIGNAQNFYDLQEKDEEASYKKLIDNSDKRMKGLRTQREQLLKEAGDAYKPIQNGNGGGGGQFHNGSNSPTPYGSYNRVTSPYQDWDADALVSRRKEMLERVRALANGADVQAVLSEDAKFITEATRNNIKTTKQAIEWYNTERLKIQDALHEKHLTNTGDWMDPKKGGAARALKAAEKAAKEEMRAALDALDAYYNERDARIKEAQNQGEITEEESKRRTLQNDLEHYKRREELRRMFLRDTKNISQEEQDAIMGIIDYEGDGLEMTRKLFTKTVDFIDQMSKHGSSLRDGIRKNLTQDMRLQQQVIEKFQKNLNAILKKNFDAADKAYDQFKQTLDALGVMVGTDDLSTNMETFLSNTSRLAEHAREAWRYRDGDDFFQQMMKESQRTLETLGHRQEEAGMAVNDAEFKRLAALMKAEQAYYDWLVSTDKKSRDAMLLTLKEFGNNYESAIQKLAKQQATDFGKRFAYSDEGRAYNAGISDQQTWADIRSGAYDALVRAKGKSKSKGTVVYSGASSTSTETTKSGKVTTKTKTTVTDPDNRVNRQGTLSGTGVFGSMAEKKADLELLDLRIEKMQAEMKFNYELMTAEEARLQLQIETAKAAVTAAEAEAAAAEEGSLAYTEAMAKRMEAVKQQNEAEQQLATQQAVNQQMMADQSTALDQLYADRFAKTQEINSTLMEGIEGYITSLDAFAERAGTLIGEGAFGDPAKRKEAGQELAKDVIKTTGNLLKQWMVYMTTRKFMDEAEVKMHEAKNIRILAADAMLTGQMLTIHGAEMTGAMAMNEAEAISKEAAKKGLIGLAIGAAISLALTALMSMAMSKMTKAKSEVASIAGVSASAGRLTTGMLTYAEGNVNEFTDPSSLTPGKQYNVDAADGRTYRARYMGRNPKTHLTNGPEFHLSGERGREMIIDAGTTRQITMNESEIWLAIQTLSGGRRISAMRRRGRGVAAFAEGNVSEFSDYSEYSENAAAGMSAEQAASLQASIDRQSDLLEDLRINGIKATFDVYGKGGLVDSYDSGKKTLNRYGQRY